MFVHQRVSTIEIQIRITSPRSRAFPLHVPVPVSVQNHISMDNVPHLDLRAAGPNAPFVHKKLPAVVCKDAPPGDNETGAGPLYQRGNGYYEQLVTFVQRGSRAARSLPLLT